MSIPQQSTQMVVFWPCCHQHASLTCNSAGHSTMPKLQNSSASLPNFQGQLKHCVSLLYFAAVVGTNLNDVKCQIMTNLFFSTSILTGQRSAIPVCLCRWTQYDRLRDGDGRAPGLLGWWPQRACTFVDNHDTGQRPPLHYIMIIIIIMVHTYVLPSCQAQVCATQVNSLQTGLF